jgi:hypothetical protein
MNIIAESGRERAKSREKCGPASNPLPADLVATDSEWDTHQKGDPWLSTTFATTRGTVVVLRDDLPGDVRARLEATARARGATLLFTRRGEGMALLVEALPSLGLLDAKDVRLAFFFSPKDVEFALGWYSFRAAIHSRKVRQRNHLAGKVGPYLLKDLSGWAGKSSLKSFATALGVPMPEKTSMDDYKECMRRGLEEQPEDYLRYAVADAQVLLALYDRFIGFVRRVQKEVLEMSDTDRWDADSIPMSLGKLVASTFRRRLVGRSGEHADALDFCLRKLGYLDPDHKHYLRNRENRAELLARIDSPEALAAVAADREDRRALRQYHRAKYLFTALDGAGVKWWASRATTETAAYNALVQGGRCHNERPDEYAIGPGLDIDIAGCYGSTLRSLTYPVGLPSVWSYDANDRRPTLGKWLERHESDLVPGLWTCTVSGPLPFEQDLLYSKLVKAADLRKPATPDGSKIPDDFALLRREVKNAVLTADLLVALRAVATHSEWRELQRLQVVTACAYRTRDRKADVGEWCRAILAAPDAGRLCRLEAGTAEDHRPRDWFGVPLEEFIGRLADERERHRGRRDGLDAVLKLMINTLYGDLASRHFAIGNTVLANNITAKGRLGVWMMAKALGLRQSITDGGIYTPGAVPHHRGRKPGLDTLSRPWAWRHARHGRTFGPLEGLRWEPGTPLPEDADAAALAHVQAFWQPYGLPFRFTLAHKTTFSRAAYWGKADYALLTPNDPVHKIRGKSRSKRTDSKPHPTFGLLDAILAGDDAFPDDLTYRTGGILKVGKYLQAQASEGGYQDLKGLRPGDNLPEKEYPARYNNTHCPLRDEATYRRRRDRKKVHRLRPVLWFESYGPLGIARVHRAMADDKLTLLGRTKLATS